MDDKGDRSIARPSKRNRGDVVNGISPEECRTARAALGWTQADLQRHSNVGITSIKRFEAGGASLHAVLLAELRRTLEAAGVVFLAPGTPFGGGVVRVGVVVVEAEGDPRP